MWNPAVPLLGTNPEEVLHQSTKKAHTRMFVAVLLLTPHAGNSLSVHQQENEFGGMILSPRGHGATSEDIFGCHGLGKWGTGI